MSETGRMRLYNEGLNDLEIGRRLKITRSAIYVWRKKRGLKSNFPCGGQRLNKDKEERRMKLYNEGLNDTEIGKKLRITPATIQAWRKSRKLPTMYVRGSKYPDKERVVLSYLKKYGPSTEKELIANTIITDNDIAKLPRILFDDIECIRFRGRGSKIKAHVLFGDLLYGKIFALRGDPRILDYILERSPLKNLDLNQGMISSVVQRYGRILDKARAQELVRRAREFQRRLGEGVK